MSVASLTSIILELTKFDAGRSRDPIGDFPSFREDEVDAAELALRQRQVKLRGLLHRHRVEVENAHAELGAQRERVAAILPSNADGEEEAAARAVALQELARRKRLFKASMQPPEAALLIEISRLQQLRRGLNIYKYLRVHRLIACLLYDMRLAAIQPDFSEQTGSIDTTDSVNSSDSAQVDRGIREGRNGGVESRSRYCQASKLLVSKCSSTEKLLLHFLIEALNNYGIAETFRALAPSPREDCSNGRLLIPWLLASTVKDFFANRQDQGASAPDEARWDKVPWSFVDILPQSIPEGERGLEDAHTEGNDDSLSFCFRASSTAHSGGKENLETKQ